MINVNFILKIVFTIIVLIYYRNNLTHFFNEKKE